MNIVRHIAYDQLHWAILERVAQALGTSPQEAAMTILRDYLPTANTASCVTADHKVFDGQQWVEVGSLSPDSPLLAGRIVVRTDHE